MPLTIKNLRLIHGVNNTYAVRGASVALYRDTTAVRYSTVIIISHSSRAPPTGRRASGEGCATADADAAEHQSHRTRRPVASRSSCRGRPAVACVRPSDKSCHRRKPEDPFGTRVVLVYLLVWNLRSRVFYPRDFFFEKRTPIASIRFFRKTPSYSAFSYPCRVYARPPADIVFLCKKTTDFTSAWGNRHHRMICIYYPRTHATVV